MLEGLRIDRAQLEQAAAEGFSLAADLADHLARTRGLPFRRAYHMVAQAVAIDEAQGWVRPETLNALFARERVRPAVTAQELAQCGRPADAVAARQSAGGPSPDDVRQQARALRQAALKTKQWVKTQQRRIGAARERTRQSM